MYDWILTDLFRCAGHSTSAAGKHSPNTVVVTTTRKQGIHLERRFDVKTASLRQGADGFFRGRPVPVVFDTETVQVIVQSYEDQLTKLRETIGVAKAR